MALSNAWPIWAEWQWSNLKKKSTWLLLSALIENITDEAWNKNKKAKEGNALYGGKPNKKGKQKAKKK